MAYTPEQKASIINRICEHIIVNKASLRDALKLDGMPNSETFYKIIDEDLDKSKQYARACENRADAIFEEILEIADDGTNDYMKKKISEDLEVDVLNSEHIQRSKLRVDTRKWMLSKMNPKKYSDKLQIDNSEFKEQPLFED